MHLNFKLNVHVHIHHLNSFKYHTNILSSVKIVCKIVVNILLQSVVLSQVESKSNAVWECPHLDWLSFVSRRRMADQHVLLPQWQQLRLCD